MEAMEPSEALTDTDAMTEAMEAEDPTPIAQAEPSEALTDTETMTETTPDALPPSVDVSPEIIDITPDIAVTEETERQAPTPTRTTVADSETPTPAIDAEMAADVAAEGGLLINLTTSDTWSAAMAITFAQQSLDSGYEPVTIWLNVEGIYLADSNRPAHTHGLLERDMQELLQDFIDNGGRVLACPACTEAAGLSSDDFVDGVEMASPDIIMPLLSDDNIQTLTW
jgi:predicted peroxiredoxin